MEFNAMLERRRGGRTVKKKRGISFSLADSPLSATSLQIMATGPGRDFRPLPESRVTF